MTTQERRWTVAGMFEGYGGLTMAVRHVLGGDLIWYAEIEPAANLVLEHHHPGVPNLGDVATVDWPAVERPDILTLGFPCTDVSSAGLRLGMMPGTRSGLWIHGAEAIRVLRPEIVVIENVRGLLSADAPSELESCAWCMGDDEGRPLRALGAVLGDLADLGYDARWVGLRASDSVGAPHARFRVFILAWPATGDSDGGDREGRPAAGLEGQAGPSAGSPADADDQGCHPWRGMGGSAGPAAERDDPPSAPADSDGIGPLRAGHARGRWSGSPGHDQPLTDAPRDGWHERRAEYARQFGGPDASLGGGWPTTVTDADSDQLRVESGWRSGQGWSGAPVAGDDGAHGGHVDPIIDWGDYAPAIQRWEHVLGRRAPLPTQPGQRGGAQLSPRFVEWLMGLDYGYVTAVPGVSRNEALKLLGNGVVPQQAAVALHYLLTAPEVIV